MPGQTEAPKPDAEADPQNITKRVLKFLTTEQFVLLVDKLEAVHNHGFGAVLITFEHSHPHTIEPTFHYLAPKPRSYKAE